MPSQRRKTTVSFKYLPHSQQLQISYPQNWSMERVKKILEKNWISIQRHIHKAKIQTPQIPYSNIYSDSESYFLYGKKYPLELKKGNAELSFFKDDRIVLFTKSNFSNDIYHSLLVFYRKLLSTSLREIIAEFWEYFDPQLPKHKSPPPYKIRWMKSRWGSCIPSKYSLNFNLTLAQTPKDCIRYIVAHELCHLLQPNHSSRFYDLQSKVFPEWQKWDIYLKDNQTILSLQPPDKE